MGIWCERRSDTPRQPARSTPFQPEALRVHVQRPDSLVVSPILPLELESLNMSSSRIKVISIASCWRSGSTLFGRILGHADNFITTGGLGYLWKQGILKEWPCTCG